MFKLRIAALAAALVLPAAFAFSPAAIGQGKTTIGVSLAQDDNPFYIAMLRGIRARAEELGWDVATVSANEDKLKQINGVQDLIARGVKGILISPIDAVGVNAAYDAAAAAKVPIVSVARGSTSKNQTIHVAMDEKQIGRDIAEWTAKRLNGKGKVALLLGPSGAPTFRNLGDGYAEVMTKYPGIQIVIKHDGPLTRERGLKQAEDALVAHPDLAAIYAANDDVALGAMQAVNAANRKDKTIVTGMNGVPPALRAVKDKNLAMTVELNPVLWGRLGVDVLASFLKGDKVEPRVFIKHVIIDGVEYRSEAAEDLSRDADRAPLARDRVLRDSHARGVSTRLARLGARRRSDCRSSGAISTSPTRSLSFSASSRRISPGVAGDRARVRGADADQRDILPCAADDRHARPLLARRVHRGGAVLSGRHRVLSAGRRRRAR